MNFTNLLSLILFILIYFSNRYKFVNVIYFTIHDVN